MTEVRAVTSLSKGSREPFARRQSNRSSSWPQRETATDTHQRCRWDGAWASSHRRISLKEKVGWYTKVMTKQVDIHKAGGIIIRDKKLLVERSKGKDFFKTPGGSIELGETPKQALVRELLEE